MSRWSPSLVKVQWASSWLAWQFMDRLSEWLVPWRQRCLRSGTRCEISSFWDDLFCRPCDIPMSIVERLGVYHCFLQSKQDKPRGRARRPRVKTVGALNLGPLWTVPWHHEDVLVLEQGKGCHTSALTAFHFLPRKNHKHLRMCSKPSPLVCFLWLCR